MASSGLDESASVDALTDSAAGSLRRSNAVRIVWLLGGLGILFLLCAASLALGSRLVSVPDILAGLSGQLDNIGQAAVAARIPRTALALVVGAALGMSGAALQAVTRNPIADPGILGISSGAALAVVIGIVFFGLSDRLGYMAFAIIGAAIAGAFVYAVGSIGGGGATPLKLALAGAATTAATLSLTSAILLPRPDIMPVFQFWRIGGVGGADAERTLIVLPAMLIGAAICLATAPGLNALALGDDLAATLGEKVQRTRLLAALGAVILCGSAVAVAGPIAFVGLVVPHLCRLLVGLDNRWVLPFSALLGAALLVASDVIGRVIARPEEIEVGIITALIGAPLFIAIVRRRRVRDL